MILFTFSKKYVFFLIPASLNLVTWAYTCVHTRVHVPTSVKRVEKPLLAPTPWQFTWEFTRARNRTVVTRAENRLVDMKRWWYTPDHIRATNRTFVLFAIRVSPVRDIWRGIWGPIRGWNRTHVIFVEKGESFIENEKYSKVLFVLYIMTNFVLKRLYFVSSLIKLAIFCY